MEWLDESDESEEPMVDDLVIIVGLLVLVFTFLYIWYSNWKSPRTAKQEPRHAKKDSISNEPDNLLFNDSDENEDLPVEYKEYLEIIDQEDSTQESVFTESETEEDALSSLNIELRDSYVKEIMKDFDSDESIEDVITLKQRDSSSAEREDNDNSPDLDKESLQFDNSCIEGVTTEICPDKSAEGITSTEKESVFVESENHGTPSNVDQESVQLDDSCACIEGIMTDICPDKSAETVTSMEEGVVLVENGDEGTLSDLDQESVQLDDSCACIEGITTEICPDKRAEADTSVMEEGNVLVENGNEGTLSDLDQESVQLDDSCICMKELTTEICPDKRAEDFILIPQESLKCLDEVSLQDLKGESLQLMDSCIEGTVTKTFESKDTIPMAQVSLHVESDEDTETNVQYVRMSSSVIKRTTAKKISSEDFEPAAFLEVMDHVYSISQECISAGMPSCEAASFESDESHDKTTHSIDGNENSESHDETDKNVPEYNGQALARQPAQLEAMLEEDPANEENP